MDDSIQFSMSTEQFEASITRIVKGLTSIEKNSVQSTTKMASGMSNAMAYGMMKATAAISLAKSAVANIGQNIPEIGRTFEIAKGIITRNLLQPLRMELLPLLQKVLSWVRDHRILFVQMGSVIVSVFRTIKTIVTSFWELVTNLWSRLSGNLEAIFGKTTKSITDIINILLFKFSAMMIFIQALLEPVFTWFADQISIIFALFTDMASGIISTVGDLSTNLDDIIQIFKDLADVIGLSNDGADALGKTFKILGQILGMTVKPLLAGVAELLNGVVSTIDAVVTTAKWAYAKLKGDDVGAKNVMDEADKRFRKRQERSRIRWDDVKDNTVEGAKKIYTTATDNSVSNTGNVVRAINNTNNNTQNVNIRVDGAQNPPDTAKEIHKVLTNQRERTMAK